jgi:hypothetical protein
MTSMTRSQVTTNYGLRVLGLGIWAALGTLGCGSDNSSDQSGACSISAEGVTSSAIATVGIVTFTVSGASSLDSAEIKFGLDTSYGLTAPVDVTTKDADYRTLLLGMKESKTYHYQVIGKSGSKTCTSPDYTIEVGGCPTSIRRPTVAPADVDKSKLDGGFMVMEGYKSALPDDYAYILDGDGDLVWCYKEAGFGDLMATRMSWDGKYMWMVHGNTPEVAAHMGRVSMDGIDFDDHSSEFTGLNHDALVLPNDEGLVYVAYSSSSGCDDIKEWKPDGSSRTIINAGAVFSNESACHGNAVKYDKSDDTIIASDDSNSAYYKIDRQGNVKWVLNGGNYNDFDKSGGGATGWTGQHNLHILGTEADGLYHILFFNNGTSATKAEGTHAIVREIALDLKAMTTKEVWTYDSDPDISNPILGDVQRLDNGNTLVVYSLVGKAQEVDADHNVLQQFTWTGTSSGIGYVTKRKTLYGPSPR